MSFKKGLSLILTFTMVLTIGFSASYAESSVGSVEAATTGSVATTTGAAFTDISGHWAEDIIKEAASLHIVGGYPEGTYLPDNLIKREEFLKLLSNILTENDIRYNSA